MKRSKFNLSHETKLTCGMGTLVPFLCQEVLPGDRWKCRSDMVLRMMPLIAPMMHRVDVYMHYFYVPTRLVWKNFETFITGGRDGDGKLPNGVEVVYPKRSLNSAVSSEVGPGTLSDYLGVPATAQGTYQVSALPFRAYNLIYNEWYRDENLQDEIPVSLDDGLDITTPVRLLRRCWRPDYFNRALPWAQRGQQVQLPFTGYASVTSDANGTAANLPLGSGSHNAQYTATGMYTLGASSTLTTSHDTTDYRTDNSAVLKDTNLVVDLTRASAGVTVEDLRWAVIVQKFLEKNARGGVRFVEFLLSHYGVRSSDARLQRPEYLGGGRVPIVIGEVLQTSSTDDTSPQGNMAGKGVSAGSLPGFRRYFEEFGYVFGILSVMPKSSYQQGLSKMWTKFSRFEQFYPEFCALGEQAVLNKELYLMNDGQNDEVFGYVPRYQEYRSIPSTVHGEFTTTLNFWHLGRVFDSRPVLGSEFVTCNPSERVFAVEDGSDKLILDIYNRIQAVRPLPKTAIPGVLL